jgi:hypothetical protein
LPIGPSDAVPYWFGLTGDLKPAGQSGQHRLQRSRIHPIGRHHRHGYRIGKNFGQREFGVIHLGALSEGVEIGPDTRQIKRH